MKKFIFLLLSVCLIFLFHCATDQKTTQPTFIPGEKCDVPVINVGDSWRYINDNKREWEHRVLGIEDYKMPGLWKAEQTKIYIVEDVYGQYKAGFDVKTLERIVDIAPDGRKLIPMTNYSLSFDFPLYVGKRWEKTIYGKDSGAAPRTYLYQYSVQSFENITVPAGTFKAFKVELNQLDYAINGKLTMYIWVSPEVKREVKFQFGPMEKFVVSGQGYELKSFKLAGKQPTTPAAKSVVDKTLYEKSQTITSVATPSSPLKENKTPPIKPQQLTPITPPPVKNMVVVSGTSGNIRSGAGNEFGIVTTVKQGDKLVLIGEHGEWFNVTLENGQKGWINSRFVK
jgi:hypothetical protein